VAAKQKQVQVPEHAKTGVWVHILDALFPLNWITDKVQTEEVPVIKRGKVLKVDIVKSMVPVKTPYWGLVDHRESEYRKFGYNRLAGRLVTEGSTRDDFTVASLAAQRKVVGDTYAIVNGTVLPLTLVPGLTGNEDSATRKPKMDVPDGLYIEIGDEEWVLQVGVSQTFTRQKPYVLNGLFVWANMKPFRAAATERVAPEAEADVTDASSLFAIA
jgi:hypothetical protein